MQSRQAAARLGLGYGSPGVLGGLVGGGAAAGNRVPGQGAGANERAARAALVICDVTTELVGLLPSGMATHLFRAANEAAARAAASGVAVIYTRLVLGGIAARPTPGRHPLLQTLQANGMLQEGSAGAHLHPSLIVPPAALQLTRHRLSPFYGTELDVLLRCHGVTDVAVAGLSTSGTVLAAARDAADRDYAVTVLSDATSHALVTDAKQTVGLQLVAETYIPCLNAVGNTNIRAHKTLMEHVIPITASVSTSSAWLDHLLRDEPLNPDNDRCGDGD